MTPPKHCIECVARSVCEEDKGTQRCLHFLKEVSTKIARTVLIYLNTKNFLSPDKIGELYE